MMTSHEEPLRSPDDQPCEAYFGNECSGFGGSLICNRCGWHWDDHPDRQEALREALKGWGST